MSMFLLLSICSRCMNFRSSMYSLTSSLSTIKIRPVTHSEVELEGFNQFHGDKKGIHYILQRY
jgi:hypothetical protein